MSIIILVLLLAPTPEYTAGRTHFSVARPTTQGGAEAKDLDRQTKLLHGQYLYTPRIEVQQLKHQRKSHHFSPCLWTSC